MSKKVKQFMPLHVAVMTVSDTRTDANDSTGAFLVESLKSAGHVVCERSITTNNRYQIRQQLSSWIASTDVQVVLINGGTGFAANNATVAAITPLFDKVVDGFGEIFRQLSFQDIGSAALQSQAIAGLANETLIFAMPGSGGAAKLAWEQLIKPQLDARQGPCNFVAHVKNSPVNSCNPTQHLLNG
ncbi:MAG: molybdenum cofactor biosynthesis protein B [Aliidiomarina sp.]|uniref:molybdenum cofactor biosynthesis protein B n=1 Tax=Aliidiomarina sp. TaxID=1872439 RepID=UPI0025C611C4|nr:molybdenum cofactor biosynthesis protein B [Aliidiomarina sp.]MCH8501095.1 molybdenum cofactor biosynthesis protein B [Aliidiomarina sp.]